jgi:hypothetical protein
MRRYSLILLTILLALAFGVLACDSLTSATDNKTPEQLLSAAWTAGKDATSHAGSYEISLAIEGDSAQMSQDEQAMMQAVLASPITISGEFASQEAPLAADVSMALSLMGTSVQLGGKVVDNKAYVNMLGQWYEAPAEVETQLASAEADNKAADMRQLLTDLNVDPTTWCTDLKTVGEETVAETETIHLTGSPDLDKMTTDITALLQSDQMAELLALTGALGGSTGSAVEIPTAADIETMMATFDDVLTDATMDFWIAKADATLRKMTVNATITIPEDLDLTGLSGATVVATVNLDKITEALNIVAPISSRPFTDFMQDMQANPLFQGILGGLSGSGLSGTGTTDGSAGTTTTLP